ncbi:MAG: hypothetical protein Q9181_007175 [Wetmoreana brouardii]
MIRRYDDWQTSWADRNALHTKMIEQAGHDRNLFHNSQPSAMVDLSFPETLSNSGALKRPTEPLGSMLVYTHGGLVWLTSSLFRVFNTGSPYNVPAGHGANLDELIAHYKKKNAEQDAKTRARMEARTAELRQERSATLSGENPPGAPPFSAVTPKK